MSGICAVWHSGDSRTAGETLGSMCRGLSLVREEHSRQTIGENAGVGVSARFATQQIYKNEQVLIACDASLVNEQELARSVGLDKRTLKGEGGTAALLASAYQRFGADFIPRLRGNFSLVLWDTIERKLLAAVDGFGVNRLAYYQDGNVLLVASRVDALARTGKVPLDVNPQAIPNLLNFSVNLGPGTILKSVRRIPPGTVLIASGGGSTLQRYWDMRYGTGSDSSEKRLSQEMESVVERAVAIQCENQPFSETGAFLSGGTDSSTVVGMLSRLKRGPAKAFSIGFQEQQFNELGYAEIAAKHFGAEHYTYLVGPGDCFEALPRMVRCFDEPFGNSSAIPTYFCADLAARHGVKVLLAGDGGDELFGGNERYATDKLFQAYHSLPAFLRNRLIEPALAIAPVQGGLFRRARGYVRRANMPGIERMLSFQFLSTHAPQSIFDPDFLGTLAGYSILDAPSRYYHAAPADSNLDRLLYVDVKITLGDSDLPKVTSMSELAGMQTRFPFLDRNVAEFSGRIPASLKVKYLEKRYLFKRAFRNLLPQAILRKKKHGFGIPVATWLKTDRRLRELSHDVLLSPRAFERGYFRRDFIEELFRKHNADDSTFYGDTLWTFLVLELWHRQVTDQAIGISA